MNEMSSGQSTGALPFDLKDKDLFRQQAYIDGQWVDADDGAVVEVTDPATGNVIGTVPNMGTAEAKRAVVAADAAWAEWRNKTAKERATILRTMFNMMMEHQDDLGRLMTAEQGKPLAEAKGEIAYAASFLEWFAEEGKRIYGETIPSHMTSARIVTLKQPVGVVGAITPWNFPSAMITRKSGPALAAGCPFVVKPANETPFSALAMAVIAERAGLPKGVMSVVTGKAQEIGEVLTTDPLVRKITFTGSTPVGKLLMKQASGTVKKMSMELGGNAAFLVFDDADLDAAVEGAMMSKYRNAGQTCVCANRIYVQEGVYDQFAEKLSAKVREMKVGNGFDDGVTTGPLITEKAIEKVEQHISDAVEKGAKIVEGGKRHALGGHFFQPTVLTGITSDMRVAREETFGPVAPLFKFKTEEEAIALANATEFGLANYFYASNVNRVWRVSEGLESGIVGINTGIISTEVAPFGGVKESGIGREGSRHGIEDFLEIKYLCYGGV